MTKHEAETKKNYLLHGELVTAKSFISYAIDSHFWYSDNWNDELWVSQAKEDCIDLLSDLSREVAKARIALSILEGIEP